MWAKQSTAATLIVGPILDSAGAEYASAVIGDLSISKNGGTLTALASAATLTHIANGQYTLVLTTGNTDTLGRAQITCNKSTYQMPPVNLMIQPAMVFDSLILGTDRFDANVTHVADQSQTARDIGASVLLSSGTGTGQLDFTSGVVKANATQFAGQTITAAAGVTIPSSIASPTNITAGTITTVTNLTNAPTNGDFTATMKASVNTEADTALADYDAPTKAELDAGLDALPTAAENATAVWANGTRTLSAFAFTVSTSDAASIAAILADTNELQTDWANGGRLDVILDATSDSASSAAANTTTILARIGAFTGTGINTILGFLKAIISKTATLPSDAGGTMDPTMDSLEALRDRGDSGAWGGTISQSVIDGIVSDVVAALDGEGVTITSPVTSETSIDIVRNADYYTDDGRQLEWTITNYDYDPTNAVPTLSVACGEVKTFAGLVVEASGSGSSIYRIQVEIDRATGALLDAGSGTFDLFVTLANGHQVPIVSEGRAVVRRRL